MFVEVAADDWLLDPEAVRASITPRTRAIMPVHLYGAVCDMERISAIARSHGLAIVEDCAEALGSSWAGQHVGSWSDVATFSFFGNKTVTTGEGGMVIARDAGILRKLQIAKGQGMDPERRYWHVAMGFNYRMTNVAAAIGLAQIERLDSILARKRAIARRYRDRLTNHPFTFQAQKKTVTNSEWLVSLLLPRGANRETVMGRLLRQVLRHGPSFIALTKCRITHGRIWSCLCQRTSRRAASAYQATRP